MTAVRTSPLVALPLRNRYFAAYAGGSAVSLVGMWMQRIAIGWLTWELTHSGLWLGIMAFVDYFPIIVFGPIAGAAADRWDRLRLLRITNVISFLSVVALWLLVVSDHVTVWWIVGFTIFHGIVVAVSHPARLAFVPSLVAEEELGSAVAIHSLIFNLARFIGPILAGVAILWTGVASAILLNAFSYLPLMWALHHIHTTRPIEANPVAHRSFVADLVEGFSYTARHPGIAAMMILLIAIGIGGRPISEFLPGLADDVYHAGAAGLSLLASATAAGAIVGALWVGNRVQTARGLVAISLGGSVAGSAGAIAAMATQNIFAALPAMVVLGFGMSAAGISIQTFIQLTSEKRMRGRVMGLYALIFRGVPAFGAVAAGAVSTQLGLRWPILLGALLVLAVCAATYLRRGRLMAGIAPAGAEIAPIAQESPRQA